MLPIYVAKGASSSSYGEYHYGFWASEDDWHYQLWQCRSIGGTTYPTGDTIGNIGGDLNGRTIMLSLGQRIQWMRSTSDYRPLGVSSHEWPDTNGLTNFFNGLAITNGELYIGGGAKEKIHPSASLQIDSTTKGFLPPRMTTTERNLISPVPAGLIIYNETDNTHQGYDGSSWNDFY